MNPSIAAGAPICSRGAGDHAPLIEAVTAWLPDRSTSLFYLKVAVIQLGGHTFATSAVWVPNGRRRSSGKPLAALTQLRRCSSKWKKELAEAGGRGLTRSAIPGRKIKSRHGAARRLRLETSCLRLWGVQAILDEFDEYSLPRNARFNTRRTYLGDTRIALRASRRSRS